MKPFFQLILFVHFFFFGCSSASNKFKTLYDPEYKVRDRGGSDVIVKSRACSIFEKEAVSAARISAEFQLRSIIGGKNHLKKFKEIKRYNEGKRICVEMIAIGLPYM